MSLIVKPAPLFTAVLCSLLEVCADNAVDSVFSVAKINNVFVESPEELAKVALSKESLPGTPCSYGDQQVERFSARDSFDLLVTVAARMTFAGFTSLSGSGSV